MNVNENLINKIEKTNIIKYLIRCFLNIKELNNTFISLGENKIKKSKISAEYYNILKNDLKDFTSLEEEIRNNTKKEIGIRKHAFEAIIETFISSLHIQRLFLIKKVLKEKCKCGLNKRGKVVSSYFSSINLEKRYNLENLNISNFFENSETKNECLNCKKNELLLKSENIYYPEILIIILKHESIY